MFIYKAVNKTGGHITGTIEAADRKGAVAGLLDKDQFVIELTEGKSVPAAEAGDRIVPEMAGFVKFGSRRVTGKDILAMIAQLSAALRAGLPLLNALEIISEQQHKIAMKEMLDGLVESVSSGQSLSEAMAKYEKIFSPLYLSMIRVGETGGILEQTTTQLTTILSRDEKIKTSMKNASAYPIFVLSLGIVSVIVIITWILPNILATISGGELVLPWPTRVLLALSSFLKAYGWLVAVLVVAGWIYFTKWTKTKGRLKWDSFKLKIPILGSVLRTIAVGRFARTLGALTKGGVSILESLAIVRDTLGNELLGRGIDDVAENVKAGTSLAEPLARSGYFPPLLVQIISIGEQTGELDELLLNAADTFDGEADAAIAKFIAIFPAVLILLLALVVGFIIAATLLPIVIMELGGVAF
ncbi:MAG: type II secretion system F family protein [Planctomycetota bacterium]